MSGGLGAVSYGGNVGRGIWQGAVGGLVGGLIPSANIPVVLGGAALGSASGGLVSGGLSATFGGNFWEGFRNGAIGGAISGGVYGGIVAANSKYDRSLLTGGFTRSGKISALIDASRTSTGVNSISIQKMQGKNAETRPILNGTEMNPSDALKSGAGQGTKSNLYFRGGRSLRAMIKTLGHELVHVNDLYSGQMASDYRGGQNFMLSTTGKSNSSNAANIAIYRSEVRAWNVNISYGQFGAISQQNFYKQLVNEIYENYYIYYYP